MLIKAASMVGIVLGMLFLSAELYLLKIIQYLDVLQNTGWFDNIWEYSLRFPFNIAFIMTILEIVFCLAVFFWGDIKRSKKK